MKYSIAIASIVILSNTISFAQADTVEMIAPSDRIFRVIEIHPSFPGVTQH